MFIAGAYFFVYAAQFLSCSLRQKHPLLDVNPVGSTFNIQNSIPHKSQKTKAVSETNRAKEFQKGTAGATESAKESAEGLAEGSDIGLGVPWRYPGQGKVKRRKALQHLRLRDFPRLPKVV